MAKKMQTAAGKRHAKMGKVVREQFKTKGKSPSPRPAFAGQTTAFSPPPETDAIINARATVPKGPLSAGMHHLMGTVPGREYYEVLTDNGIQTIRANGHETTAEGRLVLRKGVLVVAMFNRWGYFRSVDQPDV